MNGIFNEFFSLFPGKNNVPHSFIRIIRICWFLFLFIFTWIQIISKNLQSKRYTFHQIVCMIYTRSENERNWMTWLSLLYDDEKQMSHLLVLIFITTDWRRCFAVYSIFFCLFANLEARFPCISDEFLINLV